MTWPIKPNVCPGLFYGTSAQDGFLIRIRTPGGLLNHQQGRAIATLAEQWGSETIQVTNRANLQIRSVRHSPTPEVFQTLQTLGLAAQNPSIDHLRNVMTSPVMEYSGVDSARSMCTCCSCFGKGLSRLCKSGSSFLVPRRFANTKKAPDETFVTRLGHRAISPAGESATFVSTLFSNRLSNPLLD